MKYDLFQRSNVIEHSVELYRDMLIYVAFSEEPLLVFHGLDYILKEGVYLKPLEHIHVQAVL